jgi:hypothetical protein
MIFKCMTSIWFDVTRELQKSNSGTYHIWKNDIKRPNLIKLEIHLNYLMMFSRYITYWCHMTVLFLVMVITLLTLWDYGQPKLPTTLISNSVSLQYVYNSTVYGKSLPFSLWPWVICKEKYYQESISFNINLTVNCYIIQCFDFWPWSIFNL